MSESKFALKSHRHPGMQDSIYDLQRDLRTLGDRLRSAELHIPILEVWSAEQDVYVGGPPSDRWHRIVCQYDGKVCLGGPRPHYRSTWQITEKGFSLSGFHLRSGDESKGWDGQYKAGMRYDEVVSQWTAPFKLHVAALTEHIKKELHLWFPCHIYNDMNGELYRP